MAQIKLVFIYSSDSNFLLNRNSHHCYAISSRLYGIRDFKSSSIARPPGSHGPLPWESWVDFFHTHKTENLLPLLLLLLILLREVYLPGVFSLSPVPATATATAMPGPRKDELRSC